MFVTAFEWKQIRIPGGFCDQGIDHGRRSHAELPFEADPFYIHYQSFFPSNIVKFEQHTVYALTRERRFQGSLTYVCKLDLGQLTAQTREFVLDFTYLFNYYVFKSHHKQGVRNNSKKTVLHRKLFYYKSISAMAQSTLG